MRGTRRAFSVTYRLIPATPDAFCSVHSSVIVGRTSFPFFPHTVTWRHAFPPAAPARGAAATRATRFPPANTLARDDEHDIESANIFADGGCDAATVSR